MQRTVRLDEVIPPAMLERHREHIRDFVLQEGIAADLDQLGATRLNDRQVKELLEELAEDVE